MPEPRLDPNEGRYPPIGAYGLIGDMHSAALVCRDGAIDWYCAPRFDSPPIFQRLLDRERGGYYRVAPPPDEVRDVSRRYVGRTNVLETTFQTDGGTLRLTDFMPVDPVSEPEEPHAVIARRRIVRLAECVDGTVDVELVCAPRFGWELEAPRLSNATDTLARADGGPGDAFLYASVPIRPDGDVLRARVTLHRGERLCTALVHAPDERPPEDITEQSLLRELDETCAFWERWADACDYTGPYRAEVIRSAIVLKALSYSPTGALLAAPTTSLPEHIGGTRNWDYRYTWIRDASLAVAALAPLGLGSESMHFKQWLEHAAAGDEAALQVLYGLAGERALAERDMDGLDGYRTSRPVRTGNDAHRQFQLDIYGELQHATRAARDLSRIVDGAFWDFLKRTAGFVVEHWREPDAGIWESRGDRKHFVYSKVMCWHALDCAIGTATDLGLDGDLELWRRVRGEIRADVLAHGFNAQRGTFTQSYGSDALDASLLMLPLVGFLPATDPRMRATVYAIRDQLDAGGGLVYRYRSFDDGLGGHEGAFIVCGFWLVENLVLLGEREQAVARFERVAGYANDLGLLSEEIDPSDGALLGNFPQALSHLGLLSAALSLARGSGARAQGEGEQPEPAASTT